MEEPYYLINSAVRTLELLEYLAEVGESSVSEVSRRFEVNKSTAHRFLASMKYKGFLIQNEENQKYKLSFKLFELGNSVVARLNVRDIARSIMDVLCQRTGETVNLGALDQNDVVYIAKSVSANSLRMDCPIGGRDPAYCTGLGKAILAYMPEQVINKFLSENRFQVKTKNTITDIDLFRNELSVIRQQGYALDREEIIMGLCCIAAPIFNQRNEAFCSISISVPKIRLTQEGIEVYRADVLSAAAEISVAMGAKC